MKVTCEWKNAPICAWLFPTPYASVSIQHRPKGEGRFVVECPRHPDGRSATLALLIEQTEKALLEMRCRLVEDG
jgi:hypothetical protein